MSLTASQIQMNLLRHALDTLYARSSAYASRLASTELNEKERNLLIEQHRKQVGKQAMDDIESVFGRFDPPPRDPAEAACP